MSNTLQQPITPHKTWLDFLLQVIEPACDKHGWRVEYGQATDGFYLIFADADLTPVEGVKQLRLIPDEQETNQYYQE